MGGDLGGAILVSSNTGASNKTISNGVINIFEPTSNRNQNSAISADLVSSSNNLLNVQPATVLATLQPGMMVTGEGIPEGTTVTRISGTTVMLSNPATLSTNGATLSIYRFIVRSQPQPFMTTLDCADPSQRVDKRNESLSALQALATLNNGFMVTMSRHWASRLAGQSENVDDQVRLAFRQALGRDPATEEHAALVAYVGQHGLANACRLVLNLNEFAFVD